MFLKYTSRNTHSTPWQVVFLQIVLKIKKGLRFPRNPFLVFNF